jgi:hypothetical protein
MRVNCDLYIQTSATLVTQHQTSPPHRDDGFVYPHCHLGWRLFVVLVGYYYNLSVPHALQKPAVLAVTILPDMMYLTATKW